jgi:ADP-heptose:LPS heptosyltransferase
MGWGDEIMATAQASQCQKEDSRKVQILDKLGKPRWHPMWQNNPRIAKPGEIGDFQSIVNGSGARPYVNYGRTTKQQWFYTNWKVPCPGEIYFSCREKRFFDRGKGYWLIEPNIKANASPNKQWPYWQDLVKSFDVKWLQLGPPGSRILEGVTHIETHNFRHAISILKSVDAAILPEGGLHHAAAAFGVLSIVIFGGITSPNNTGYDDQINFYDSQHSPCGWRLPCSECQHIMKNITVDEVVAAAKLLR